MTELSTVNSIEVEQTCRHEGEQLISNPVVCFRDLWFMYPYSSVWAIKDVNLQVKRGECVCIAGPSGCGKTTLCMCINGIIPHYLVGQVKGEVFVHELDVGKSSLAELSQKVGLVFQNPESQLFSILVIDEVAFGPENLSVPPKEILERVTQALDEVDMSEKAWENIENLSCGQKQRVALASVLSMRPDVLVLDEPLSQLDWRGKLRLLQKLKRLKSYGITIIIAEHNIPLILDLVDRIVLMNDGKIILERQTNHLSPDDIENIKRTGIRWHLKCEDKRRKCQCPSGLRVVLENVSYAYPNGTQALKNIALSVGKGEFLGLVGENGSGKSTLLKCVAGLLKPKCGKIVVTGINNPGPENLFGRVGFLLQNPDYQLFEEDVFNEVAFPLRNMGLKEDEIVERVSSALESVDMKGYELKNPLNLSMGQKHRVALASILAMKPKVMLLDEPAYGLDYRNVDRILNFIKSTQENLGTTVIVSSHDREMLESYADRIVKIVDGHIENPTRDGE